MRFKQRIFLSGLFIRHLTRQQPRRTTMTKNLKLIAQKGSMMVEALAMLGLIAMVTPVLYKKAAERTTELQDINAAAQMRTISKALDDYIKDNYIEFTEDKRPGYWTVTEDMISSYLPYGFNLKDSKLFTTPEMAIKRVVHREDPLDPDTLAHATLTGIVVAPTSGDLPGIRSAKIASMIGANGSVYKKCAGADGAQKNQFCGVQGTWFAEPDDYGVTAPKEGSIASISLHAINSSSGAGAEHVLFRDDSMNDPSYNRMQVSLLMDGNPIEEVNQLIALGTRGSEEGTPNTIEIVGALKSGGNYEDGNLVVQGAGTIRDLLTAGSANIASTFEVDSSGVSSNKKVTISSGGLDVTGDTTLDKTTIDGEAMVNTGKLTANAGAEVKSGLTVTGGSAATGDGNTYSLAVKKTNDSATDGSLLVQNNARIDKDLYVGGDFSANKIYGRAELGGGLISGTTYNFKATSDRVDINKNIFTVGDRLETSDTLAELGVGNVAVGANTTTAYLQYDGNNKVTATAGNVSAVAGTQAYVKGGNSTLTLAATADLYGAGAATMTAAGGDATVKATGTGTAILQSATSSVKAGSNNVRLSSGASNRFLTLGSEGMAFGVNDGNGAASTDYLFVDGNKLAFSTDPSTLKYNADGGLTNSTGGTGTVNDGVYIRRGGMIYLPRAKEVSSDNSIGKQDTPGYIKLDRILANQKLEESKSVYGGKKIYDAYQVNPAYTSVMHDIKLTTRGNARLSDILPDFINKGIYVIDNTYEEPASCEKKTPKPQGGCGKSNWENYEVTKSGGILKVGDQPVDCGNDANCITTPWLGFVPTPQCPPGYSKVITINPIRWKMAEAYSVAIEPTEQNWTANKFKAFFVAPRNPFKARFELSSETVTSGNAHTHSVPADYGMPLTFQTNTWLNTTIAGVRVDGTAAKLSSSSSRDGDFAGWHAIMGFLYHGTDYKEYLHGVGGGNLDGKIVWNLFPVYKEELTAIANVYCYFERRKVDDWVWNPDLVDTGYNQLQNFRTLTDEKKGKNTSGTLNYDDSRDYQKRLNDPALGYNNPW